MKTREDLLQQIPKNTICAEIGIFEGEFSQKILEIVQPSKLYMVDLFAGMMCSGDKNGNNIKTIDLNDSYNTLKIKYANVPNVEIFKGTSELFYTNIPDHYLDFIYIDGDHTYNGVKFDLNKALNKVKYGGFISGHDYTANFEGIIRAVNEFCNQHKFKCEFTTDDGCASYLIYNQ